uniref:MHC class I-like antigen recognition-like domain-containing protein n=1 Tax=Anolis carolinensis TaxID=28377 RepID=A0A803T227_ANOCA
MSIGGIINWAVQFFPGLKPTCCAISWGSSSHSLRYVYTSVSEPGQQEPQFFSVGYMDEQQFVSYDAKAKRRVPTVPWIRKQVFREFLATLARYYNQSGGTHTWQSMYGCELRRDGSKGGYWQYAYDGRDYISLDKETLTWMAADVPAQNTKRKWEAQRAIAERYKAYLEEECIQWLHEFVDYGKETLLRTG